MATKKTFKDIAKPTINTAAAQFISTPAEEYEAAPERKETKSKRFNLLVRPSTAEALAKIAVVKRTTVNNIVNELIDKYTADNADALFKYEELKELMKW